MTDIRTKKLAYWQRSIPSAPVAMLRVLFGFLMLVSCARFIMLGWIDEQYIQPKVHFPYTGFEWVVSLGDPGMYWLFGVMTLAAIGVMLGAWYRISSIVFFLCFTYIELIDKTYYLNHYYFVSLIAFLFCCIPAHSAISIDSWMKPALRRDVLPQWMLDVFKIQISIVYVYAGLAKITSSWLIDAMPLRIWLPAHADMPVLGSLFALEWVPWVFAWSGMVYDVSVPFFLAWKQTRPIAYVSVLVFHTITGLLFQIGVFPIVMIGMTLVFFADTSASSVQSRPVPRTSPIVRWSIVSFVIIQLILPWRFLLYPGELFWTEQGYRFSWRVMLMEKAGTALFTVEDRATGRKGYVDNRMFLNEHQEKQMAMQPDMVVQYAHVLHDYYSSNGLTDPKVTAEVWVTLNGAPSALLVDPQRDLAKETLGLHNYDWILSR